MRNLNMQRIFLMFCLSFLIACANEDGSDSTDSVVKAYQLIDEQRTDEAIALLENELVAEPDNYNYKVTLASAYAHRGGMKVQRFVPLIGQVLNVQDVMKQKESDTEKAGEKDSSLATKKSEKEKSVEKPKEDEKPKDPADVVSKTSEQAELTSFVLNQSAVFFGIFGAIPDIKAENVAYLTHAIAILNDLGDKIKNEDRAYRIVLNIILLKHRITDKLVEKYLSEKERQENDEKNLNSDDCKVNIVKARWLALTLSKIFYSILSDIIVVQPDSRKEVDWILVQNEKAISDLTVKGDSETLDEDFAKIKSNLLKSGFGKIFECGGDPLVLSF